MKNYKEKIKHIRIVNKLTQSEFAEKLGVSRGVVALIETGKNNPTSHFLNKIKEVFNINLLADEQTEKATVNLSSMDLNILNIAYSDNMKTLYFLCSILKMNNYIFNNKEKKDLLFYEGLGDLLHDLQTGKQELEPQLFKNLKHIINVSIFHLLSDYYFKVQKVLNFEVTYSMDEILDNDFSISNLY